ncbi:tetratricopeptide repeat-containing glycosyltransferase family 2 protein [Conexibacter arvalis]|uniref:Tetratricopeptide (TPR) repeat protein n=1 Tax=Conexibacter arvalis TaxID=912552 RepID=A0A840IAB8_9ACTN|nr:glycosyltransferase family 2 protein [Conexibacter arvalis]MBB4661018.1 tetratricopeptide (TPR) repeat protein [Conexibacter arvalis]
MALRLTGSTPSSASTPIDPAAAAAALLARGDLDGFRALFAEAAALDDVHERYARRKALVEAGLRHAQLEQRSRVAALYAAVAHELVAVLEEEPREPVLLNYAGVLFYELWGLPAAHALFTAARRLDPELPEVGRNLAELARRRRAGAPPANAVPKALAVAVAGLGRRAERVAERARPAEGLTLSLCMIVRDEEEMLPRCLAAVAEFADELVIVDTGSTDRTVEIAESFGARVLHHEWTGSFADARNVSFDAATGDWLMYLDADEVLVVEDGPQLRSLLGQTWREAFFLSETNYTGELGEGSATVHNALRVFRARPQYRFTGRLHEQILDTLPRHLPERIRSTDIRVEHYGYLGAVRDAKEKSRRNVELLLRQREEQGDSTFLLFNLGSEYAAAGEAERALAEFEAAWRMARAEGGETTQGYMPALVSRLVRALRVCRRHEDAIARAAEGLELFPGFTDLVYEQACCEQELGRLDAAVARFERCIEMGDAPGRYTATVGMGTYLPTIALAEIRRRQGDHAAAVALLDPCLSAHPEFFGIVLPFASAMLADGLDPAAVVARVEHHVGDLGPTVRYMLATALYEQGEAAAAEAQYRVLLERQPANGAARVALAEALLTQRRYAEAAETAAALDDAEPHAGAARRSELFARIVGGELERAAEVLAATASLAPGDRELFQSWLALADGGEPPVAQLPAAALPLLAVTLEALLRVEEVDAFGQLVALVERTPLPPRERRELLADMYLRRGFLASAAEEWMAVCSEDPRDVRALVGIAQAAAAQGMTEEALDFAREAHALDPEDARAARLLQRLEPLAA